MNHILYTAVAEKYGIRAALVCGYLWQQQAELENRGDWLRVSQRAMTAFMPFLSVRSIGRSAKRLDEAGVIRRKEKNESAFDRTHSYRFTDYGQRLMHSSRVSFLSESKGDE
jgi:hypothetical protein